MTKLAQELTYKILSFDTRGGNELPLVEYLDKELSEIGLQTKILKHENNRASLLAWTGSLNKQKLCFNCHLDVVPYVKKYLFEDEESIYAPGAVDTKKDVGPQLAALKEMKDIPDGLVLAYDADEEYNNIGINALKEHISAPQIVISEPTNMDVYLGAKGWTQVDVTSHGEQCHSNNAKGYNAPEKLILFMHKLLKEGFKEKDEMFGESNVAIQHFLTGSKEDTRIEGNANLFFTMAQNTKYDSIEKIKDEMNRLINETKVDGIEYEITDFDSTFSNFNSKLGEYMMKTFNLNNGICPGWCNSHVFRDRDVIIFGIGDILLAHTNKEFVTKKQINQSKEIYEKMIKDLL